MVAQFDETDFRLEEVEREVQRIREARAEEAGRVTRGYTIEELSRFEDSALRRLELEVMRLRSVNADLLVASRAAAALIDRLEDEWMHTTPEGQQLRAAIARATGGQL